MSKQWFVNHNNQQLGPFTTEHLRSIAANGHITPKHLVWTEGFANWVPVESVEELFPQTATQLQSPPKPASLSFGDAAPSTTHHPQSTSTQPEQAPAFTFAPKAATRSRKTQRSNIAINRTCSALGIIGFIATVIGGLAMTLPLIPTIFNFSDELLTVYLFVMLPSGCGLIMTGILFVAFHHLLGLMSRAADALEDTADLLRAK